MPGANCDDIEIGCGGTLLKLIAEYPVRHLGMRVLPNAERAGSTRHAEAFLEGVAQPEIRILDCWMLCPLLLCRREIKEHLSLSNHRSTPTLVFTHYREDRHQDRRLLSDHGILLPSHRSWSTRYQSTMGIWVLPLLLPPDGRT